MQGDIITSTMYLTLSCLWTPTDDCNYSCCLLWWFNFCALLQFKEELKTRFRDVFLDGLFKKKQDQLDSKCEGLKSVHPSPVKIETIQHLILVELLPCFIFRTWALDPEGLLRSWNDTVLKSTTPPLSRKISSVCRRTVLQQKDTFGSKCQMWMLWSLIDLDIQQKQNCIC